MAPGNFYDLVGRIENIETPATVETAVDNEELA